MAALPVRPALALAAVAARRRRRRFHLPGARRQRGPALDRDRRRTAGAVPAPRARPPARERRRRHLGRRATARRGGSASSRRRPGRRTGYTSSARAERARRPRARDRAGALAARPARDPLPALGRHANGHAHRLPHDEPAARRRRRRHARRRRAARSARVAPGAAENESARARVRRRSRPRHMLDPGSRRRVADVESATRARAHAWSTDGRTLALAAGRRSSLSP